MPTLASRVVGVIELSSSSSAEVLGPLDSGVRPFATFQRRAICVGPAVYTTTVVADLAQLERDLDTQLSALKRRILSHGRFTQ